MPILAVQGAFIYALMIKGPVALLLVLSGAVLLGFIFGKVFCRWMCPVGLLMEVLLKLFSDKGFRQMYQYHKLGCPVAWISGFSNHFSLFKIGLERDSCTGCGKCDKQCYMVAAEPERFSLYKGNREMPGSNYACSKCLECVAECPNGSLNYKIQQQWIKVR